MEKEFIPYEQALDLKELGFDEPCFYQYVRDFDNYGELIPITSETNHPILRNNQQVSHCSGGDCFAAPLYQQVFRWFREKYQLSSWIYTSDDKKFYYSILKNKRFMISEFYTVTKIKIPNKIYNTYEESELACLNKLIRIVKKYYDNGRTL